MLKKLLNILLVLSIAANVLLGMWLFFAKDLEKQTDWQIKAQQTNGKILFFTKVFVKKVLQGKNEVEFEDRLQLENLVKDINDREVISQWQKFVKSQSDKEAQQEAGALFSLLLSKISY